MSERLSRLLSYSGLGEAEELTGKDYKEDELTANLGAVLHMLNVDAKRQALLEADDTTFSCDLQRYLRIVGEEGFEPALELQFSGKYSKQERFYVFFKPSEGVLLKFDTFTWPDSEPSVNGGQCYYNWKPAASEGWSQFTSSGGMGKDGIWDGDHDCREALRFHMRALRENGSFVTPWVRQPFLWLLHHGDTEGGYDSYDYKAVTAERIAMLPAHVRAAIEVSK